MFFDKDNLNAKKAQLQMLTRESCYDDIILADLVTQLEYEDIADLDLRFFIQIEIYKITEGQCFTAISPTTGNLTVYKGDFAGAPDVYGMGENFIGTTENGESHVFKVSDGVVFRNNKLYSSELANIGRFSAAMANVDDAQACLVNYTKVAPTVAVGNTKVKEALEQIFNNMSVGKPSIIQKEEFDLNEWRTSEYKFADVIDITDPSLADKLQYLSQYTDDLQRRIYTYYGLSMNGAHKMAQQSIDEISATDSIAMVYPLHRLKVAEEDIKLFNEKFGYNVKVHLNEIIMPKMEEATITMEEAAEMEGGMSDEDEGAIP